MKLGVIIPYRNREQHLKTFEIGFKNYIKNTINYELYVIEQEEGKPFNRGKLLNIGFFISKDSCDYVVFHDVDMLPLDADYSYVSSPTHMATECSQFDYSLPYESYFGGVTLFNKDNFCKINGYNNEYWGWGAEDDDLRMRCEFSGLKCERRRGRYMSLHHKRQINKDEYSKNIQILKSVTPETCKKNGLNSLNYNLLLTKDLKDGKIYKVSI